MYYIGEGMPKDSVKAVEWWQKAAVQGDARAQASLGAMYGMGEGVPRDMVLAYAWFNLSAIQQDEVGKKGREQAKEDLTPAERIEALVLSSKWKVGETLKRVGK